ncbi:MAG: Rrf2 family transcriptional regulator [Spirochaetes bacterium]|nr:Rrf2 family transcriptional regulator [Spirochaetota bacterium]
MKLSTRTRYGLRFMYQLALQYNQGPIQLSEIAKTENVSEKYLGQIVIHLRATKLIQSHRGAQGGYFLAKPPNRITVYEVVQALEGDVSVVGCTENPESCERSGECAATEVWKILSDAIRKTLENISLEDMIRMGKTKGRFLDFSI